MNRLLAIILAAWVLAGPTASASSGSPQVKLDEALARRSLDSALMCLAVYNSDKEAEVTGWNGPAHQFGGYDFREGTMGLYAGVYDRSTPAGGREAVLAYRGTEVHQMDDWLTDLSNFWGLVPDAYIDAGKFAQAARAVTQREGCQSFSLTGHSMGGGLACYAALLIKAKATCFGSAALGEGMQEVLWKEAAPHTEEAGYYVLHVFKEDDMVPPLTASNGRHLGSIAVPMLRSPPGYNGLRSPEEKLGYLVVSGYLTHKWIKVGAKVAATQIAEGHGIDQYIAGLTNLITPPGTFCPAGEWVSKGSFFDLTSTETRFRFCRNGNFFLMNDVKFLELPRQHINYSGNWEYQQPYLHMTVPGVADMTYLLLAGNAEQSIEWRRFKMAPDLPRAESATTPEKQKSVMIVAKMIEVVMKRMEGKTVIWKKSPPSLLPIEPAPRR
jgi:hypothetical protein